MSDEEHHFESKADAGASKTYPQQAGTIRKNGYIVITARPCKVHFHSDLLFLDQTFSVSDCFMEIFVLKLFSFYLLLNYCFWALFVSSYFFNSCFFEYLSSYCFEIFLGLLPCDFSVKPGIYSVEGAVFYGLISLDLT